MRLQAVRPCACPSRSHPSTSTSNVLPSSPRLMSDWTSACRASSLWSRAEATSAGTLFSLPHRAAAVPGRGEIQGLSEVFFRLSREADDEVRGDRDVGNDPAHPGQRVEVALPVVAPLHAVEDAVRA